MLYVPRLVLILSTLTADIIVRFEAVTSSQAKQERRTQTQ